MNRLTLTTMAVGVGLSWNASLMGTEEGNQDLTAQVGQPADIQPSAYCYRADRPPDRNPPESWILLMQYAKWPWDRRVNPPGPAFRQVLCGFLWEEVRPLQRVELSWTGPPHPLLTSATMVGSRLTTGSSARSGRWPEMSVRL